MIGIKFSDYNLFFPHARDKNKKIIYNSRTGATAVIDTKHFEETGVGLKNEFLARKESRHKEVIDQLKMGEFIISKNIDEKRLIHLECLKRKFSDSSLDLTLIPTLSCNFACIYCYEKEVISNEYMSKQNQDAVIEFISEQAPFISNLHITWYGGEPLLALSIIESLTKKFLNISSKHNIKYSASIVTNGYLLSNSTLNILKECLVKNIQITLDGMTQTHDIRRPLKDNKGGTFDKIIKNLEVGKELLPKDVMLRINTDKDNIEEAYALVDYLNSKDLLAYVSPYLGKVENQNDCYSDAKCLTESKYVKTAINLIAKAYPSITDFHPKPTYNFCGADFANSYTINYDGSLYKCWEDIGRTDKIIGHIQSGLLKESNVMYDYVLYDIFNNEKCSNCRYLPICLGGCPRKRKSSTNENCERIREYISSYIELASQEW